MIRLKDAVKIIRYYGVNNQQRKFAEETFELQEAVTKYGTNDNFANNKEMEDKIIDEVSDVLHLVLQFILFYKLDIRKIYKRVLFKIKRQLERIELEKAGIVQLPDKIIIRKNKEVFYRGG